MNDVVIACNTLKDEINLVITKLNVEYSIYWVDSGMHNFPQKLNEAIQIEINKIENAKNIILLFGSCGNSLIGLSSPVASLIIPLVSDCISMFLGGDIKKQKLEKEAPGYYFTGGYLENEANIWSEFNYSKKKYGEKKARYLFQKLLHNYKKLRVIDTGAYDPQQVLKTTNKIAREFELDQEVVNGTLKYIYKALNKKWDKDFVIIQPDEQVTYNHFNFYE